MKLTLKKFNKIKNQTKKELLESGEDKHNAKPIFKLKAFEWDFHRTYPPSTERLFFWWEKGEVFGKRTTSFYEGPFAPNYIILDEDYLKKVFEQEVKDDQI